MRKVPEQFSGGALLRVGSNVEVRSDFAFGCPKSLNVETGSTGSRDSESSTVPDRGDLPVCGASNTSNCATLPAQRQRIGERGGILARRRFQKGRVFLRGKKNPVWVGRWREDVIENGETRRIERSEVLGTKSDFPTKRLALRELEKRLSVVNDPPLPCTAYCGVCRVRVPLGVYSANPT